MLKGGLSVARNVCLVLPGCCLAKEFHLLINFFILASFRSYSGPGSQLVTSEWKFDFNTFLSSGLGYIVLEVDGAGSSGRGQVTKNSRYQN